jgi:MFS family permease
LPLIVLLAAVFMTTADNSIVNVAVPSIRIQLAASSGELQLVITGYILAYAALLVAAARLGATYGYWRVLRGGLALFTVASLACGLAPTPFSLILARIVQGVGAALMVPQVLVAIQAMFEDQARTRALGFYSAALALGAAAGQVLGGGLIAADLLGLTWRPIFLINVPVGLVLLAVSGRVRIEQTTEARLSLDFAGAATLASALALMVGSLVLGREAGWPGWSWVLLLVGISLLATFFSVERSVERRGRRPLLDLGLLRISIVALSLSALGVATVAYSGLLFVLALYLQEGIGRSALYSGLAVLPWIFGFGLAGAATPRLIVRFGHRVIPVGFAGLAACFFTLSLVGLGGPVVDVPLFGALALGGAGMGVGLTALLDHVTKSVPATWSADLSGLVSTTSEVFSAVGVAVAGGIYLAVRSTSAPEQALVVTGAAIGTAGLVAALAAHRSIREVPFDARAPA